MSSCSGATPGFGFACALLVACVGFLFALARAVQQSIPCGCFGRLGRTAAGGREIGRADRDGGGVRVSRRAPRDGHEPELRRSEPSRPWSVVGTALLIGVAQRIGARIRPGVELGDDGRPDSLASSLRGLVGVDNDLYTLDSLGRYIDRSRCASVGE